MTAAIYLLAELNARDVRIERHGARLTMRAPGAPPAELLAQVRELKDDLLSLLPDCDAAKVRDLRNRLLALASIDAVPFGLVHALDDEDVMACSGLPENTLRSYVQLLARDDAMDHGLAPPEYTATVYCDGCGPVLLWPTCPPRLKSCPWCFRRKAGKPIPRPQAPRKERDPGLK